MTYAEGGTISYANGKRIHTFADSGTLVVTEAGDVEALVVAGGGAGGGDYGHTNTAFGGGGGGGVIYTAALAVGLGNIAVTVGEGGISMQVSGGLGPLVAAQNSSISDGNVNFSTQTAIRGGTAVQSGGSGGGGGGSSSLGGDGTGGQGNDGGDVLAFFVGGGGGGGGGGAGSNSSSTNFGDQAGGGGAGYLSSISGTAQRYGAGGGGGAWKVGFGTGGVGGGGDGGWSDASTGTGELAEPGTGYGAGGGGQGGNYGAGRTGGAGHKGVVIFSYDSDFNTGRRVAQNEDLANMTASTIKGRITTTGIPQDLTAAQVAALLESEITERAQDAVGSMVADTATIDITYTDATPELKADVRVDSINDTHIDWGTGTNQVNLDDVPDGSTYVKITATNHTDLTDGGATTLHTHAAGDVTGPAIASDTDVVIFDGTTGKIIKDSGVQISTLITASQVPGIESDAIWNATDVGTPNAGDKMAIVQDGEPYVLKSMTWTGLSSYFAPTAKGVTNGDTHDHNGGDGAQIAHGNLSSIGTNTHAQIDTHIASVREKLTAARSYYVRTDGSDSNTGLVNSAGGAFLTLNAAVTAALALDTAGYAVTVYVGAGTYTGGLSITRPMFGGGTLTFEGDTTTPSNVVISTTSLNAILADGYGVKLAIRGFKVQTTTGGNGVIAQNQAIIELYSNFEFGACAGGSAQVFSYLGGRVVFEYAMPYTISGAAGFNLIASGVGSYLQTQGSTVTITGSPVITVFAEADYLSNIISTANTYSGAVSATTNRYSVTGNAVIVTFGGANYFPGTAAGATATGGQYI